MEVIESKIDPQSEEFRANREHNLRLVEQLRGRIAEAQAGGPPMIFASALVFELPSGFVVDETDPSTTPALNLKEILLYAAENSCVIS